MSSATIATEAMKEHSSILDKLAPHLNNGTET